MARKKAKNAIARDLRSAKYRPRVVKNRKIYSRRPKHRSRPETVPMVAVPAPAERLAA